MGVLLKSGNPGLLRPKFNTSESCPVARRKLHLLGVSYSSPSAAERRGEEEEDEALKEDALHFNIFGR